MPAPQEQLRLRMEECRRLRGEVDGLEQAALDKEQGFLAKCACGVSCHTPVPIRVALRHPSRYKVWHFESGCTLVFKKKSTLKKPHPQVFML